MRRGRIFIYLGLILILGLVATFALISRLGGGGGGETPEGVVVEAPVVEMINVVITTQRIRRGEEITEGVIQLVEIPQEQLIDGMFTGIEDVIGSLANFDLEPGVFVTEGMVVDFADQLSRAGSPGSVFIPPGFVAVSIPVDRLSSVSYGVWRGDHVNVIVTILFMDVDTNFQTILPNSSSAIIAPGPAVLITTVQEQTEGPSQSSSQLISDELLQTLTAQIATGGLVSPIGRLEFDETLGLPFYIVPSETQRPRAVSQTLIQDAIVLQMGNFQLDDTAAVAPDITVEAGAEEQTPPEDGGTQPQPPPSQEIPDIVTLIVSPQDAVTLNYLLFSNAKLSLALRSANDDSQTQTEAVTLQFLLDQYNIPVPAKLPFGMEPRIDLLETPVLLNDITPPEPDE